MKKGSQLISFAVIVLLFFMWGFITCMNDLLIPKFKEMFDLNYAESMFVQFAFFGAYFIGSLIYFIISVTTGDPISKLGYKKGILLGLIVAAGGCALFYPASTAHSYLLFLGGLFVIGLGVTVLQIAANPYVTILGEPEGASGRLNLSQAFNSLGTTLAPMVGGIMLARLSDAAHIHFPYLMLCGLFLLLAVLIAVVPLPQFKNEEKVKIGAQALKDTTLLLGIVAIFCYVGAEVCIGSSFKNCSKELIPGITDENSNIMLAFYWGGLMIGRFLGSLSLVNFKSRQVRTDDGCVVGHLRGASRHHLFLASRHLHSQADASVSHLHHYQHLRLHGGQVARHAAHRHFLRGQYHLPHLRHGGDRLSDHLAAGGHRTVQLGDVGQHLLHRHRQAGRLPRARLLAAGDGHCGRRPAAPAARPARRPVRRLPLHLYRAHPRLLLLSILRHQMHERVES